MARYLASLDEINKFAYPKDDLVGDLTDVVQYGRSTMHANTMIEVTIEDEHVWIHLRLLQSSDA